MKKIRTHYDNLKVARNAPQEVIRAAYKTLSQKYHPDRNGNSEESQRVMKIINESYGVLSDQEKRHQHDQWIAEQESLEYQDKTSSNNKEQIEVPAPTSGHCFYAELSESEKVKIKQRISGEDKNQYAIQLDGVNLNYLWMALLSGWFYYLFNDASQYKWGEETIYWHAGFTFCVSVLLGKNATWIYSWHMKPLKSFLIVTPLYVIKTRLDQLWYWPIWTISDIKATHNYRNGSYQNTSLLLLFDGKQENFSISPESTYTLLLNRLQEYDEQFRTAIHTDNLEYIINNNDFLNIRTDDAARKKRRAKNKSAIIIYFSITVAALALFGLSYSINLDQPTKPDYKSRPSHIYNSKPKTNPNYVRPLVTPNGSRWPSAASYVESYPKLHTNGLSSVSVDNTKNNSDVFVKLVALNSKEAYPVRVFYIPAFSRFKLTNIDPGAYDIRYKDLTTGDLAKSESFKLEEINTYSGTRYSEITITLYKVRNGNMQTYDIPESEF